MRRTAFRQSHHSLINSKKGVWPMDPETVELPIDGTLDLHTFSPREIGDLIPDYLGECRKRGITSVRIIHGKGKGNLRRSVQAILGRLPEVVDYRLADETSGSWGATLVQLRPSVPRP
jgi:DNA-nicking Smr family endonuclease